MAGTNVPGLDNTPQISPGVPGLQLPNRREFGQEGQAVEHIGQAVESVARTGTEIYDEIQRQHDISTASKNYVDSTVSHAQELQNLKLTSPDGFIHDPQSGEIIKNSDGTPRTIAHEYWDWADQDYQIKQKEMSPRAAAMYRQQMLPHIGDNTKVLQNDGLHLQRQAADTDVSLSMAKLSRDNDRTPYPEQNPYYEDRREDGSINLRQNTDKINEQLRIIKQWTGNQGPTNNTPGMYSPPEVAKMSAKRLSEQSDSWVRSAITNILESDTPRDHRNRVSTTAMQQVLNLRDIIEGKDPQSLRANKQGLPTVNNSLTSEQIDKWRSHLNGMLDGAKKIDRSDYELQLSLMKSATASGNYSSFDALVKSPEFGYLVHAAQPLGLTPEEQIKNFSEIFGNAAKTAGHSGVSDLASESTKRAQIAANLRSFELGFPQYSKLLGVNFTGAMANAIIGEAGKSAYSQLEEENRQYRDDPAKFAAGMASGPQNPLAGIQYRNQTMKAVEDKLYSDPSLFAIVNPMATNGKPLISNAIKAMKMIGAQGFGQGFEPTFLSRDAYEAQANKIDKSNNPEQVEQFFQQLVRTTGPDAGTVMDQLVKVGKLDPRYQMAQNLPTAQARIAAYADIMSKGAAIEAYTKSGAESAGAVYEKAMKANELPLDFNNRLYGADSPDAARANKMLLQTWSSKYAAAMGVKGTSQSDAAKIASDAVSAQIPPVSQVGDSHHFLGFTFGSAGPQSKVQFSSPNLSADQQETIRQNLNLAQKENELSKYQLVPAPIAQGAYDFNKKLTAKWIAEHPFVWYPVRQGTPQAAYRLQYQGMNADGSPSAKGYDVKIHGSDGTPRFYEVKESDALVKRNQ